MLPARSRTCAAHDREGRSGLTRAASLDPGVKGDDVGLPRQVNDRLGDSAELPGRLGGIGDLGHGFLEIGYDFLQVPHVALDRD